MKTPRVADPNGLPASGSPEDASLRVCKRVGEMRKKRAWTLEQLSAASGVSRSMLSQIERGKANPTLGIAFRIAQAFGQPLAALLDQPIPQPGIDVVRNSDPNTVFRADDECGIRTLSPLQLEKDVEFYELVLRKSGVALRSAPHFSGTREIVTVARGSLRVSSGSHVCELHQGDSAHYNADVPHSIENIGPGEAVIYLVDIYREIS